MFHVQGDKFAKHALPYKPMLDPVTGALFVVGFLVTVWRWRTPGFLLCQCWLWFGLLAGMLSTNFGSPHAYRTGNVAPAAVLMAALPLGWLLDRARPTDPGWFRKGIMLTVPCGPSSSRSS